MCEIRNQYYQYVKYENVHTSVKLLGAVRANSAVFPTWNYSEKDALSIFSLQDFVDRDVPAPRTIHRRKGQRELAPGVDLLLDHPVRQARVDPERPEQTNRVLT